MVNLLRSPFLMFSSPSSLRLFLGYPCLSGLCVSILSPTFCPTANREIKKVIYTDQSHSADENLVGWLCGWAIKIALTIPLQKE